GLEVGSKPELMAALAIHEDDDSLLICNGYKDAEFIQLALDGMKLGKKIILVIEKLEELNRILEKADACGIKPGLGLRIRLQTKGVGKWATSGGEDAKFGLSTADVIEVTRILKSKKCPSCLKLLHFHVGSQISDIVTVGQAVREVARYYAKLEKMGFNIDFIDVGGGFAVDYDGSRTTGDSSMNYTDGEYTRQVINTIYEVCSEEKASHPHIVSESGRALVAHHSILIVEAFGSIKKRPPRPNAPEPNDHKLIKDISELASMLSKGNRRETLHEALRIKEEALSRFELGILELEEKAQIESWFWHVANEIVGCFERDQRIPPEVAELKDQLGEQYLCNFSVFQSLIDYWAVEQLFPVVPIHHLDKKPTNEVTLVDITCDSDGKITNFVNDGTSKPYLALHDLNGSPYYIGVFLVGAYQDVMGDIHNLFAPVPEVHIFLDEDESTGFYIEEVVPGNTIREVLTDVQYEPKQLIRMLKKQVDAAIKRNDIKPNQGMKIIRDYEKLMDRSTYLKLD
ncbi:MAG: biosynthetic arginine decarboxylase, partial [Verrucomicrobiota bacterium]